VIEVQDGDFELSTLEDRCDMIVRHYSDMFVECDDHEVQQLKGLLSLFFAKCDGLCSPAEVLKLESVFKGGFIFDPYTRPAEDKGKIIAKLEYLKKHNIKKPKEVTRFLVEGLYTGEKIGGSHCKYLVEFMDDPGKPFNWYANRLKVSVSSVTRAFRKLTKSSGLTFFSHPNYPMFKLKHFNLFFQPNESFQPTMISEREFAKALNYDTFGEWMWTAFLVPDQSRILDEFKGGLARFADEVLRDYHLYEFKSVGSSSNFSMFDGEKWSFDIEAFGIGAFELVRANESILPRMNEFTYGDTPIRFDRVDFLLATFASSNCLAKNSELRKIVMEYGCGDLSPATIQRRLATLRDKRAIFNDSGISRIGLTSAFGFAIECDEGTVETLYHLFPIFPECWAYRTNKGVFGMILGPPAMAAGISYVLQGLKDEVDHLFVTSRFANIGSRSGLELYKYWNAEKQYWDFERGFFDLTKGMSERV
jgi:hypothetical protein